MTEMAFFCSTHSSASFEKNVVEHTVNVSNPFDLSNAVFFLFSTIFILTFSLLHYYSIVIWLYFCIVGHLRKNIKLPFTENE